MPQVKVLLVQLASTGDCLLLTCLAKQIKLFDYPGCHLTWMIGKHYSFILSGNTYIDSIVEVENSSIYDILDSKNETLLWVKNLRNSYDEIFLTNISALNVGNWFGTTRTSLLRGYKNPIGLPLVEPLIYLSDSEVARVADFANQYGLTKMSFNILIESSPLSGQSFINQDKAIILSEKIVALYPRVKVVLSSKDGIGKRSNDKIIDGSKLSYRENAELLKYCDLLIGGSSGISWLNTSNWSPKIPMLQIVNPRYRSGKFSASLKADFLYFGLSTKKLIEFNDYDEKSLLKCIGLIIDKNFGYAKIKFDLTLIPSYGGVLFLKEVFINIKRGYNRKSNFKLFFSMAPSSIYFLIRSAMRRVLDWIF